MAVCFATLQQFSELENCFIDGTPLRLEEAQLSKKEIVASGWEVVSNECGSVHDTVSESLDSETLRRRKTTTGKIANGSRWTGYSPDECYSPAFAYEIVDEYLHDTRWRGLPKNAPSAEEKVTQWMSYGKSQPDNMLEYSTTQFSSPVLGYVQDRRARGRRSRSIILRFEAEQRQNSQSQEQVAHQPSPTEAPKSASQGSRTKRRKNMDTTSKNVGVEKPLPQLPRKGSVKKSSATDSNKARDEVEYPPRMRKRPEAATHEVRSEQQYSSSLSQTNRSAISDNGPLSQQERPMMPRRVSKSNSKKPSPNIVRASSPKPLQLVTKVKQHDAEQAQPQTVPKSRKSCDEALKKLENVNDDVKPISYPNETKSESVGTDVMRKVLGLTTGNAKASVEQIETVLRKPVLAGRPEKSRPAPIDMGAVLEANKSYLNQQVMMVSESQESNSGELCHTPEEILYSEHPSALIPRPLSLPFRKSGPCDVQIMSPIEMLEPSRDRLMRHRRFFDNRPLARCLDGDGVDDISEGLYDRLIEETKLFEARQSVQSHKKRAFWDNVRLDLNVEEDEEESQIFEEFPHSTGVAVKGRHCTVIVHPNNEQQERRSY